MKVGLLSLRVFPQQQCSGHGLCDSAQPRQFKQQLRSALVAAQWRGGHRLNTFIVLAAVHGLSGLFRVISAVEFSLFRPLPPPPTPPPPPPVPVPNPNKQPRFCGRKAKWSRLFSKTMIKRIASIQFEVRGQLLRVG